MVPFECILEVWRGKFLRLSIRIPAQIFIVKTSLNPAPTNIAPKPNRYFFIAPLQLKFIHALYPHPRDGNYEYDVGLKFIPTNTYYLKQFVEAIKA